MVHGDGDLGENNISQYRYQYQYHELKTSSTCQRKNLETRHTDIKNGLSGLKRPADAVRAPCE